MLPAAPLIGRLIVLTVAALLSLPAVGAAQDIRDCQSFGTYSGSAAAIDQLAAAFRQRPKPIPGELHASEEGTVWRLVADAATGLALPRFTAMRDRAAMESANRLLDADHGCLLLNDRGLASHAHILQPDRALVAVTYASPHLVSYVEMRVYPQDAVSYDIRPKGVVLDLAKGRRYEVSGCGGPKDDSFGWFRLGDLLRVCSFEARAGFMKIWMLRAEAVAAAAARAPDACERRMGLLEFPSDTSMYLTERGLAVYDHSHLSGVPKVCLDAGKSLIGPIVIPYGELTPFMAPGPWRNELLKRTGGR